MLENGFLDCSIIVLIILMFANMFFFYRWLEKKDSSFILNALNNMKRNANETMDEFNLKFEKIIQDIP
jgi:hypothetical protein